MPLIWGIVVFAMASFVILIDSDCFMTPVLDDVRRFCQAAVDRGDHIRQIFLYREAVLAVLPEPDLPSDEPDLAASLAVFCQQQQIPLFYCATAAQKRGITQARQGFVLSGLAEFAAAVAGEKLVQF
jgi:tRNA 2-thiouridine synthesizing protein D